MQELKDKFPEMPGIGFYGSPPGNHSVATGHDFVVDLNDTATLELITFANVLAKEMFPDDDDDDAISVSEMNMSGDHRQRKSLDGDWKFELHGPAAPNSTQLGPMIKSGSINVPGSWEAQGYGNSTGSMRYQVLTGDSAKGARGAVGIYTVNVTFDECTVDNATVVLTIDRGIHRHALFKIAGQFVGEHRGYLTPFEAVLAGAMLQECHTSCEIEITLDGGRPPHIDPLMGAMDDDTDGEGLNGWVGLNGHVVIECRPPVYIDGGVGGIVPPQVTHPPVTVASAGKPLQISVGMMITGGSVFTHVQIFDVATNVSVASSARDDPAQGHVIVHVTIPAIKLWSPEERNLYRVVATIYTGSDEATTVLDMATTRFGVRTITTDGYKLMLNGLRVFLSGYGDDSVYPLTVSPPREKAPYEQKVKLAHELGFNFVRHHSHVLREYLLLCPSEAQLGRCHTDRLRRFATAQEYHEATDEWGILVSPELACAYSEYYAGANATGIELYTASWTAYIQSLRNHPSIFDWAMCNENYSE
jgi:beta-galactosidase/beta-glucuronidase